MAGYRLKLTQERCAGIYALITSMLEMYEAENIPEDLIDDHLLDIARKFQNKLDAKHIKEWSVTISIKEAKAYWTFFNRVQAFPHGFDYEKNLVREQVDEIERLYCPRKKYRPALSSGQKQLQRHG